jgi:hypothetical protein
MLQISLSSLGLCHMSTRGDHGDLMGTCLDQRNIVHSVIKRCIQVGAKDNRYSLKKR